jgi:rubrerythrin
VSDEMNALEFAIKMELDGEQYYLKQAEINRENGLYEVCIMLANDEAHHAKILISRKDRQPIEMPDSDTLQKTKDVFTGISDIKMAIKPTPSQLDFYRIASEKEEQSIAQYSEMLSEAKDKQDVELFEYLIGQEKHHFEVLDNLADLLRHAEEWVESAEFGLRKDF